MKSTLKHIPALVVMILLLAACNRSEEKVIPRGKLARIYAEMLMTDQWIGSSPDLRKLADTSLVYEPILMKYGYDSEDYRHTINEYLGDPERFSRILRTTSEMFDKRIKELEGQKKILDAEQERLKNREKYRTDFKAEVLFPYMGDQPYVVFYDSLKVEMDTLTNAYRITAVEVSDTLYDRIEMIILKEPADTAAAVSDSLKVNDTLKVETLVLEDRPRFVRDVQGTRTERNTKLLKMDK